MGTGEREAPTGTRHGAHAATGHVSGCCCVSGNQGQWWQGGQGSVRSRGGFYSACRSPENACEHVLVEGGFLLLPGERTTCSRADVPATYPTPCDPG